MYDPERAYRDIIAEEKRLEVQKDAWGCIGEPGACYTIKAIETRLAGMVKRRHARYVEHVLHQMRFWRPTAKQMRVVVSYMPPKGSIP